MVQQVDVGVVVERNKKTCSICIDFPLAFSRPMTKHEQM
jgi:hypothetical protein